MKKILLGIVICLAAVVVPVAGLVSWIAGQPELEQHVVPGSFEITAPEPGQYMLWHVYRTEHDGVIYDKPEHPPDGWQIVIRNAATGQTVGWKMHAGARIENNGVARRSIGLAELQPGRYRVTVTGPDARDTRVIAVSRYSFIKGFVKVVGAITLLFAGFGLGVLLVVLGVTELARSRKT